MATRRKSTTRRKTTRRRNPSMVSKITDIAGPAVAVIGGQAVATQLTQLVLNQVKTLPANARKLMAMGIPAAIGVVLMMQKNKLLQSAGVGSVSSGVLYRLKVAMPSLKTVPLAGEISGFLADNNLEPEDQFITDEDGNVFDLDGNFLYSTSGLSDDFDELDDDDESGFLNDEDDIFAQEELDYDYA